jgi:hypothetical protein
MMCFSSGQTQYVPYPSSSTGPSQTDQEQRDRLNRLDESDKQLTQKIQDNPPVVLGASRAASQVT